MQFLFKTFLKKQKKIIYSFILLLFSISFNQFYGYVGVFPLDSFIIFNSGYDLLNGYFPFKDYWTITGPMLDIIQAFFFKLFGVSWSSYVLHASFFNFIISFFTFYTLVKFKLNIHYSFFYSLLVSCLAYPIVGTPFMDHHSAILSIVSLFVFILAIQLKINLYWFFLPIILGCAFLSKQTPAAYTIIIITILSLIYFFNNFNRKKIIFFFLGIFVFTLLFILTLRLGEISIISFIEQYILFPQSMGKNRLDLLFPLEFKRIILRFKLIYISIFIVIFVVINKIYKNYRYLFGDEFIILISLVGVSLSFILHQLMTINAKFIFFIIPIMVGFSHIYYNKYFKQKKYFLYSFVIFSLVTTLYYQNSYNKNRRFMDLRNVNIEKAINAVVIDEKLKNLKWITVLYPDNPEKEILNLKEAIKIINKDNKNKTIVTDYQFVSVILSIYDYSPNRFWHKGVGYPIKGEKYFEVYKNFFVEKLKENKIEIVYTLKPLYFDKDVLDPILNKNCFEKNKLTDILDSYLLLDCDDLN